MGGRPSGAGVDIGGGDRYEGSGTWVCGGMGAVFSGFAPGVGVGFFGLEGVWF